MRLWSVADARHLRSVCGALPTASREVGDVLVVYGVALGSEPFEDLPVAGRVPEYDGVGEEAEAQGPLGLLLGLALADVAFVGEEEEAPQGVQLLALVELAAYAASEILALREAQQEEGRGYVFA